jgi:hypothetical protein
MAVYGILPNRYGTYENFNTSLWQLIFSQIKATYDAAAAAYGLQNGLVLSKDSTYIADGLGLGILDMDTDADGLFKRIPVVGYGLDTMGSSKPPKVTGAGDGANWEYHKVFFQCVPIVNTATDSNQTQSTNRLAIMALQTAVWNVVGRQFSFPIVDSTGTRVNQLYPQVGYAEILEPTMPRRPAYKDALVIDRRDFNIEFNFRVAIATLDGV